MLAGGGPSDVVELTVALAAEMLAGVGITGVDPAAALADGRAMDVWRAMIAAQGGDPDAPLPVAAERHVLTAPATGVLTRLDAYAVGRGGLAARRRPGPQGGPGVGRGRRAAAGQAGGPGDAPASRCWSCTPTSRSGSSGRCRRWTAASTSAPSAVTGHAAGARPGDRLRWTGA